MRFKSTIIVKRLAGVIQSAPTEDDAEGYLLGLLIATERSRRTRPTIAWPGARVCNGDDERPGVRVMKAARYRRIFIAASKRFHRLDRSPRTRRISPCEGALKALALNLGLAPGAKHITPAVEKRSAAFQAGMLRGLFDADGSVQGSQAKGVSVRLAQSTLATLEAVQRMLQRLGIVSKIYIERRPEG